MSPAGKPIRLMIIGDSQANIEEVLRLSSSPMVIIQQAQDPEWAMEQFDREPCDILALCHHRVSDAEHFYMRFMMFSERAMNHPHQTILMCDGKESTKSCELCRSQVMDDYVIYKPLYDVNRLKFAMQLAMDRLHFQNAHVLMEERLKSIVGKVDGVKDVIVKQLESTDKFQSMIEKNLASTEAIFENGLSRLKDKISELENDGVLKIEDQQTFDHAYNQFQAERLTEFKDEVSQQEFSDTSWMDDMKAEFTKATSVADSIVVEEKTIEKSQTVKVLIVEDEVVNQKMMEMILTKEGYEVKVVGDGMSAVSMAEKWSPHVILMDIRMPKMNGLKATQKLKSMARFKNVQIIMLTAHSEKAVVRECLKSGAADFIVKPAQRSELLERIAHLSPLAMTV